MSFISDSTWNQYKEIINEIHYDFFQADIIWLRSRGGLDRNGEDNKTERFDTIPLKGLINFNDVRTWPITRNSNPGEIDDESEVLHLNIEYLKCNGYINSAGNFDFNPAADRFIHKGLTYKSMGYLLMDQAHDEPLLLMIILQRQNTETGNKQL